MTLEDFVVVPLVASPEIKFNTHDDVSVELKNDGAVVTTRNGAVLHYYGPRVVPSGTKYCVDSPNTSMQIALSRVELDSLEAARWKELLGEPAKGFTYHLHVSKQFVSVAAVCVELRYVITDGNECREYAENELA
ncbi:MAG: hypothetical protein KGL39_01545 [Patescibacteria group bacterium]|nr:hypothetical protein [Patescibacteria group bacterium]